MNINKIINNYDDFLNNSRLNSAIQLLDNEIMVIENCKGICLFNENEIHLRLMKCKMIIVGLNLKMRNFSKSGVEIKGKIHSIDFEENGGRK